MFGKGIVGRVGLLAAVFMAVVCALCAVRVEASGRQGLFGRFRQPVRQQQRGPVHHRQRVQQVIVSPFLTPLVPSQQIIVQQPAPAAVVFPQSPAAVVVPQGFSSSAIIAY